jgi:hypothetical protein
MEVIYLVRDATLKPGDTRLSVSACHRPKRETDGGTCMDTGKIMMGTALLLITIGLLVHPAGAAEPGDIPAGGQRGVSENPGCVTETCIVQPVQNLPELPCMIEVTRAHTRVSP